MYSSYLQLSIDLKKVNSVSNNTTLLVTTIWYMKWERKLELFGALFVSGSCAVLKSLEIRSNFPSTFSLIHAFLIFSHAPPCGPGGKVLWGCSQILSLTLLCKIFSIFQRRKSFSHFSQCDKLSNVLSRSLSVQLSSA